MTAERGGSAPQPGSGAAPGSAGRPGWFARVPLWLRVAAPVVLLALIAIVVAAWSGVFAGGAEAEPEATAEAACRSAATERLETRGHTDIDIARSLEISEQADGGLRIEGTVTFDEDGDTRHRGLRCIVRMDGGTASVVSVRFSG